MKVKPYILRTIKFTALCFHRCRLTHFFGHLDAAGLRQLPESVDRPGLKIASAADARVISDLTVWQGLEYLSKFKLIDIGLFIKFMYSMTIVYRVYMQVYTV